jgi:hypothetical protein
MRAVTACACPAATSSSSQPAPPPPVSGPVLTHGKARLHTGTGGGNGIVHIKNWLRSPYVSICLRSHYLHPSRSWRSGALTPGPQQHSCGTAAQAVAQPAVRGVLDVPRREERCNRRWRLCDMIGAPWGPTPPAVADERRARRLNHTASAGQAAVSPRAGSCARADASRNEPCIRYLLRHLSIRVGIARR